MTRLISCFFAILIVLFSTAGNVRCQDELLALIEKRQKELDERERNLKVEEERLAALKRDLELKIKKYSELLKKINSILDEIEQRDIKNMEYLVKVYESMPPEEAGERLSALDELTAVRILERMKPRKAAAILSTMDPGKVSSITRHLSSKKNIPRR
ncbi:MAG: hypothetical protein N2257_00515 [Thermodesulfovibrionales bacterium]|nr:hypothetical protein [Thermodesulfovibrionales bacterium]